MTHIVDTTKTSSNTYTYDQFQYAVQTGAINTTSLDDVSVFTQSTDSSQCTDGEDDGKIGFLSAVGNAVKGAGSAVVNGIKGMFTDEDGNFSIGQTLKTAGMAALCCVPGVGPVIATGLCAYGVGKSAIGVAKGISAAASAETDAEAKAAFQSIGANTLTGAVSAVGLKASVSAVAEQAGVTNAANNSLAKNISETAKNLKGAAGEGGSVAESAANVANRLTNNYYKGTWQNAQAAEGSTLVNAGKSLISKGAKGTVQNIVDTAGAVKKKANETVDKLTGKSGQYSAESASALESKLTENGYTKQSDGSWTKTNKNGSTSKATVADDGLTANYSTSKPTSRTIGKGENQYTVEAGENSSKITRSDGSSESININNDGSIEKITQDSSGNLNKEISRVSDGNKIVEKDFNSTKIQSEYKLSESQMSTLKDGGSVTTDSGVTLTTSAADDFATVKISQKANVLDKALQLNNEVSQGVHRTVNGINSMVEGQATAAGLAVASNSMSNASSNIEDSIDTASTTYVTTSSTSGVRYGLEDYTLPTTEEMDQSYAEIFNSVQF